jgi:hypothetical protein
MRMLPHATYSQRHMRMSMYAVAPHTCAATSYVCVCYLMLPTVSAIYACLLHAVAPHTCAATSYVCVCYLLAQAAALALAAPPAAAPPEATRGCLGLFSCYCCCCCCCCGHCLAVLPLEPQGGLQVAAARERPHTVSGIHMRMLPHAYAYATCWSRGGKKEALRCSFAASPAKTGIRIRIS